MTGNAGISRKSGQVTVMLGSRSYEIVIGAGLLASAPQHLMQALPGTRFAIVADWALSAYAQDLERRLKEHNLLLGDICFVPPGEGSKSFSELERVCNALLDLGIERSHAVIALGGGVIGDLAGFAASILKRGVRLVQVPTTLLAQVDSSVGGKTGIDTRQGKNLVGTFHQPSLVLTDLSTLNSLPDREFRAGYAEVVKYGVLGDQVFFEWLEANGSSVFARDSDALTHAILRSCQMKAEIVARDELEKGDRALLNLGHTFGHAVEAWAGYSGAVLHGEGVALGMVLAAKFSQAQGLCGPSVAARLKAHLSEFGLPGDFKSLQAEIGRLPTLEELLAFMEQDKKVRDGQLTLVLLRGIGQSFVASDVPRETIRDFLQAQLINPR